MTAEARQKTQQEVIVNVWRDMLPKQKIRHSYQRHGDTEASALRMAWPQIDATLVRLAMLLYADLPMRFGAADTIYDTAIQLVFDNFRRHGTTRQFLSETVFGVTECLMALMEYTVCYVGKQQLRRRWEPMETTIYALATEYPIRCLTLIDEPHPMRGHRDAGIILASRVFTIRDMAQVGMLQR